MNMHFKVNQFTQQEWMINYFFPEDNPPIENYISIFHYHKGCPNTYCGIENYRLAEDRETGTYKCKDITCNAVPPDNLIKFCKLYNFMAKI